MGIFFPLGLVIPVISTFRRLEGNKWKVSWSLQGDWGSALKPVMIKIMMLMINLLWNDLYGNIYCILFCFCSFIFPFLVISGFSVVVYCHLSEYFKFPWYGEQESSDRKMSQPMAFKYFNCRRLKIAISWVTTDKFFKLHQRVSNQRLK